MKPLKIKVTLLIFLIIPALTFSFLIFRFLYGPFVYNQFNRQSDAYYAKLAAACDFIIQSHPVGTNRFVLISTNDPSLPEEIRSLHPKKMYTFKNGMWILHGAPIEFGIDWEQSEFQTNQWVLCTTLESHVVNLYVANR